MCEGLRASGQRLGARVTVDSNTGLSCSATHRSRPASTCSVRCSLPSFGPTTFSLCTVICWTATCVLAWRGSGDERGGFQGPADVDADVSIPTNGQSSSSRLTSSARQLLKRGCLHVALAVGLLDWLPSLSLPRGGSWLPAPAAVGGCGHKSDTPAQPPLTVRAALCTHAYLVAHECIVACVCRPGQRRKSRREFVIRKDVLVYLGQHLRAIGQALACA